ncbi:hypothetical protein EJB05_06595, partial [Eragrostis curvula]
MLYVVCLGLGDERGVTVRGLDAVRRCARVYMEFYASLLALGADDPPSRLAMQPRKSLLRPCAQTSSRSRKCSARSCRSRTPCRFLFVQEKLYGKEITVANSPLFSDERFRKTTHTDLVIRAKKMGIEVKVIDSASVVNAVGVCGLQLHRYGEAITIPFFSESCKLDHFYQAIVNNR